MSHYLLLYLRHQYDTPKYVVGTMNDDYTETFWLNKSDHGVKEVDILQLLLLLLEIGVSTVLCLKM